MNTATQPPVAFLDIGTNAVRVCVARAASDGAIQTLGQWREVTRLGEPPRAPRRTSTRGTADGREPPLIPAAMRRTIAACRRLAAQARRAGARTLVAVATAAVRDAPNGKTFIRRLRAATGLHARVLSGQAEARLIHAGMTRHIAVGRRPTLFLEIGGGSTEVAIGTASTLLYAGALRVGAVRLARYFPEIGGPDPVTDAQYARLMRFVRRVTAPARARWRRLPRPRRAIGSGGGLYTLGAIAAHLVRGRAPRDGDTFSLAQLRRIARRLCALPLRRRARVPGLDADRADIILGGAAILEALLTEFNMPSLRVTLHGLRAGLMAAYFARAFPVCLRRRTTLSSRRIAVPGARCHAPR